MPSALSNLRIGGRILGSLILIRISKEIGHEIFRCQISHNSSFQPNLKYTLLLQTYVSVLCKGSYTCYLYSGIGPYISGRLEIVALSLDFPH